MLYRTKTSYEATSCFLTFKKEGRIVVLTFHSSDGPYPVHLSEALMAEITGHFLRERLFGLH